MLASLWSKTLIWQLLCSAALVLAYADGRSGYNGVGQVMEADSGRSGYNGINQTETATEAQTDRRVRMVSNHPPLGFLTSSRVMCPKLRITMGMQGDTC